MTKNPSSKAPLLIIFLTVFIDLLGFGMVLPLLPIYGEQFASMHGLSKQQTGWVTGLLMSSFSAMQFLFLPLWGRLSDRYGRRPILIIGLAGSTLFYALFGIATMRRSLLGLFVTRIGAGIAGATISTAQAFIADSTTKQTRAKGMALIGAAFALGFTVGPVLGGISILLGGEAATSPWPGFVAAALSGVALLLAVFLLPESLTRESETASRGLFDRTALRQALSRPSVAMLLAATFVAVFSFANFESTLSLQVKQFVESDGAGDATLLGRLLAAMSARGYDRPAEASLLVVLCVFTYLGVVLTLAQGVLVRRLATRVTEAKMATWGAVLAIIGFALLALAAHRGDFVLLLVAMLVEVMGFAFVTPSLQSLISRRSDPRVQGGILGLGQSLASLARILGPLFGLRMLAQSRELPYVGAMLMMVVGLLMIVVAARRGSDFVELK